MTVVDASVLVALVDGSDLHHQRAHAELSAETIQVTQATLVEVARVVRRRSAANGMDGHVQARIAVRTIISHPGFQEAPNIPSAPVLALYERNRALSWADCVAIVCALSSDARLATFDAAMSKAWGKERRLD